jgi:hypothetical protein
MKVHALAILLLLISLLTLPQSGIANSPGQLLPSEAFKLMMMEAMNRPESSRKDIYEAILPRVMTESLGEEDQFYLGEVYFFALMPEEARDAYYPLLDGTDMTARVAWQRLLQIRFRAFQMYERAAMDMVNFRKRFPAEPADREYLSRQVQNFGSHYADQGSHVKVVEVVEQELAALNFEGAYTSFVHPATFIDSYVAIGKKGKALEHLKSARMGLAKTLADRKLVEPREDYVYPLPADRYFFLYTPLIERLGWKQTNDKFEALIERLAGEIERIEMM